MIRQLSAALAVGLLTACGAPAPVGSAPAPITASPSTPPSPSLTPSPSAEYATPQQLASIIAMQEDGWREVADGALECRDLWASSRLDPDDPILSVQSLTCHMREATITLSSENALRDLAGLEAEPSMASLVSKTEAALRAVMAADVNGKCDSMGDLADTDDCKDAHLSALLAYRDLDEALDGWRPYL